MEYNNNYTIIMIEYIHTHICEFSFSYILFVYMYKKNDKKNNENIG